MQMPLQIAVRNTDLSDASEALIRRHVGKLETFYDRITSCRVMVEVPQRYPAGGPIAYNVRIDLTVPGEVIVIKRQPHREIETAIQEAFDAAGRRLQDYSARHRRGGEPKHRSAPSRGVVTQLFPYEGYGFLETDDGREVYFHRHSVLDEAFDRLAVGSVVRFEEEEGIKGRQASTVVLAGTSH